MTAHQMMQADSARAVFNVNLPAGALPWQILAILLIGFFVVIVLLIQKANWYKGYAKDFPTQTSTVIAGITGFAATLLINLCRGALGMDAMDGSEAAYTASAAFAGVGGAVLGFKRFSSPEYQEGKAKIEAAKATATPPQPTQVLAGEGSSVRVQTSAQPATPVKPAVPQAGVEPKNPAIVAAVQSYADKQRAAISNPGEADD